MNFLGIDAGTTCCKGVLFDESGNVLTSESRNGKLTVTDEGTYIDIELIFKNICDILSTVSKKYRIDTVTFTSLGESFAALDKNDEIVFPPMLYSDPRGAEQAERIARDVGSDKIFALTGVSPNAIFSLYKLLWWRDHRPEDYKRIDKILLVGDYLAYRLTGKRMINRSLASRTGVLDLKKNILSAELLALAGLDPSAFSTVVTSGTVIGDILPEIAKSLGIQHPCTVIAGAHDQICSSIGSGALHDGVGVDGMGTVECIVALFKEQITDPRMGRQGYACVPYVDDSAFATYLVNYTCGGLMNWFRYTLLGDRYPESEESFYTWAEKGMDTSHASDLIMLPHFRGASTPINDVYARGVLVGLTCDTTPQDICKALYESTSYAMRHNLETMRGYGTDIKKLIATGGCSRSDAWMQIKSNILNTPVTRPMLSDAGCCGVAMLAAVATGCFKDLEAASKVFVTEGKTFYPQPDESFERNYEKYKKLYDATREFV